MAHLQETTTRSADYAASVGGCRTLFFQLVITEPSRSHPKETNDDKAHHAAAAPYRSKHLSVGVRDHPAQDAKEDRDLETRENVV